LREKKEASRKEEYIARPPKKTEKPSVTEYKENLGAKPSAR
jgi:hypothetical protein